MLINITRNVHGLRKVNKLDDKKETFTLLTKRALGNPAELF